MASRAYEAEIGRIEKWSDWIPIMVPDARTGFKRRASVGYRNKDLEEIWSYQYGIYELALLTDTMQLKTVYIGSTCREKEGMLLERIEEYCRNGSHKAEFIDDALMNGYTICARYRTSFPVNKGKAEDDENNLLKLFDYPWNKRENGYKTRKIHP